MWVSTPRTRCWKGVLVLTQYASSIYRLGRIYYQWLPLSHFSLKSAVRSRVGAESYVD